MLDGGDIKRLIKIAGTTMHGERDQTVIVLSYWLGLRAKELASLKTEDVYLSSDKIRRRLARLAAMLRWVGASAV